VSINIDYDVSVYPMIETGADARPRNRGMYKVAYEDPAIRTPTESGFSFSRPRYRRNPMRLEFEFGYVDLSMAQYQFIKNFWEQTQGGSFAFYWIDRDEMAGQAHADGVSVANLGVEPFRRIVRFTEVPVIRVRTYGDSVRYDVVLKIKEV
jgi:hypothetical protein